MRVLIRCDSSQDIGTGHVQRCLTLAEALRSLQAQVFFFSLDLPGNIAQQISARGFSITHGSSENDLLEKCGAHIGRCDLLVLDHYLLDETKAKAWRALALKTLVIDDLANRFHLCDYLLDSSAYDDGQNPYLNLTTPLCQKFLGPKYALLRDEFKRARKKFFFKTNFVKGLFFFGGTDPLHQLPLYHDFLLNHLTWLENYSFDFILGEGTSSEKLLAERPTHPNIKIHIQPASMAQLMLGADFYLGSGGTVTWERMHLGLTGVAVSVASNQIPNCQNLARAGCHVYAGEAQHLKPQEVFKSLQRLLNEPQKLQKMSEKSFELVDGSGMDDLLSAITQKN